MEANNDDRANWNIAEWDQLKSDDLATWRVEELTPEYRAVSDYSDLRVWRSGIDLTVEIYRQTERFPPEERFGLSSQLRRASVSVPSHIAEGNARNSTADYLRFLRMARGSLAEMRTQLLIAQRLDFLNESDAAPTFQHIDELTRQLAALHRAIERSAGKGNRST